MHRELKKLGTAMKPLATCLAVALALPISIAMADGPLPIRPAATLVVTNCGDYGPGSLRQTIAEAASGDTVDLNELICPTITLVTGAIPVVVTDLTLSGSGGLTIEGGLSAGHYGRVLNHLGNGTLTIQGLTIANAKYQGSGFVGGGCIYSNGNVTLASSKVTGCAAVSSNGNASGGGVYARGNVTLMRSTVTGNRVETFGERNYAEGGGVTATRSLNVESSTIENNQANAVGDGARGGGLFAGLAGNSITIANSTISRNHAKTGGGLFAQGSLASRTTTISNSTVSGNSATIDAGGIFSHADLTTIANSTIAFNSGQGAGAGLDVAYGPLRLQSSIIAGNRTLDWQPSDLVAMDSVSGANNLITSSAVSVPLGTINACPKLGPLADNGGMTKTHALLHNTGAASPAIDAGPASGSASFDQRSAMEFPRRFGATVDIGAYEWQGERSDRMFVDRFESVCD